MEFHGTARVSEIGALHVPWNSMEFHGTTRVSEIRTLQVPWNSTEFHGTARASEIGALLIPWNSMELLVSAKLAHLKFHWIQWICSCHRNWRTPSSMEFRGTAHVIEIGALQVPWNSMELLVSVPWNSMEPIVCYLMEPLVSSTHWVLNWDRIPWNLSFEILKKIIFNCAGWINFRKLINTIYLFYASLFHQLMFIINICIIPYAFLTLLIMYQNIIQNLFLMPIETYFDQKVPWNFLQSSMELFEQHLNNTCGSMEFHGT